MEFNIHFENEGDLLSDDASLSIGWISVDYGEIQLSLFKKRGCLIFLTLCTLLENMEAISHKKKIDWVGEDNGSSIRLSLSDSNLCIGSKEVRTLVPLEEFKMALKIAVDVFLEKCISSNTDIQGESAFQDLKMVAARF
jgi:hypothetical protein